MVVSLYVTPVQRPLDLGIALTFKIGTAWTIQISDEVGTKIILLISHSIFEMCISFV